MHLKVQAFQIKHVLDLIFGNNSIEWKAFGRYWLGIRLKLIEEFKTVMDWKGPFADTANHFYQKCHEYFKYFLQCKIQQEQRHSNSIKLRTLYTKDIYDILLQSKNIRPLMEEKFPLTSFNTIYKLFNRVQMQALDLDLEYKIIHRAITVKAKLHRFQLTNNNTCPPCLKACETISHLFVHCKFIQNATNFIEHLVGDVTLDEFISLQWVYPDELNQFQIKIIQICCILFHNAVWQHRNEVNFDDKTANVTVITSTFKAKSNQLFQIKAHQMKEVDDRLLWGNIEIKLQQV